MPWLQVTQLKTQCETLLEKHEEDIEEWYFERQEEVNIFMVIIGITIITFQVSFEDYICRNKALKKGEDLCLEESLQKLKKKTRTKAKGETGSKTEL
jgi:hypothetical protein